MRTWNAPLGSKAKETTEHPRPLIQLTVHARVVSWELVSTPLQPPNLH